MKILPSTKYSNGNSVLFFTATILQWQNLLKPDKYKDIIINSLSFLSVNNRIKIGGFVIMPNHFHLLFRVMEPHLLKDVQRDLLKFTAQQIKFDLQANHPLVLERFVSTQNDRAYQIWECRPLAIPLYTNDAIFQKLNYIHNNPCSKKWRLVDSHTDYKYSSTAFYFSGDTSFSFITHYMDI